VPEWLGAFALVAIAVAVWRLTVGYRELRPRPTRADWK